MLRPARLHLRTAALRRPRRARGFIMALALIALVILALAAASLMRTVSVSNIVAGNLAFEQTATHSADAGVEDAIAWLENNAGAATSSSALACSSGSTVLACDQNAHGYIALRQDPDSMQTWATLWAKLITDGYKPVTMSADDAGNTAAYFIQRMCSSTGDASSSIGCSAPPSSTASSGCSMKSGSSGCGSQQVYYRITVKVAGPRDTISYTQVMVAQ